MSDKDELRMQEGKALGNMAEEDKPRGDKEKARKDKGPKRSARTKVRAAQAMAETGSGKSSPRSGAAPRAGAAQPRPQSEQVAKVRGGLQSVQKYLKSVKTEFYRVTWPTGQELRAATIVVIAILVVVTFYLFVVNESINKVFEWIAGG
jgi:preprotein translocase subunit SecE